MLTDETIRKISEEEMNSAGLSKLPDNFFEDVRTYLENKARLPRNESEQWTLDSVKRRLRMVHEKRERKILSAAPGFIYSAVVPEHMTELEKKLFGKVVDNLKDFQKERDGAADDKDANLVMINILEEVHKFVGMNMKHYGPFARGDVATLPAENAELLIQKGMAEKMEIAEHRKEVPLQE
jgi:DNA replication initiation complex subunit (GINS family)